MIIETTYLQGPSKIGYEIEQQLINTVVRQVSSGRLLEIVGVASTKANNPEVRAKHITPSGDIATSLVPISDLEAVIPKPGIYKHGSDEILLIRNGHKTWKKSMSCDGYTLTILNASPDSNLYEDHFQLLRIAEIVQNTELGPTVARLPSITEIRKTAALTQNLRLIKIRAGCFLSLEPEGLILGRYLRKQVHLRKSMECMQGSLDRARMPYTLLPRK